MARDPDGLVVMTPHETAGRKKVCTDMEFRDRYISTRPASRSAIVKRARAEDISSATVDRYLKRLTEAGAISSGGGLYWFTSNVQN